MQPLSEQALADRLRARTWESSRPGRRCLDEVEVATLLDGGLAEPARQGIEGHLAACGHCLGMMADLLQLRDLEPPRVAPDLVRRALERVPEPREWRRPQRWQIALPLAATLMLAVGVSLWQQDSAPVEPSTGRATSGREAGAVRQQAPAGEALVIIAPAEGAVVAAGAEVRWSAASRGLFYELQVVSDEGSLVWQGRTEETSLRLPAGSRLADGGEYFLWVRAYLPEGKTARTPAVGFRVEQRE